MYPPRTIVLVLLCNPSPGRGSFFKGALFPVVVHSMLYNINWVNLGREHCTWTSVNCSTNNVILLLYYDRVDYTTCDRYNNVMRGGRPWLSQLTTMARSLSTQWKKTMRPCSLEYYTHKLFRKTLLVSKLGRFVSEAGFYSAVYYPYFILLLRSPYYLSRILSLIL